MARREVLKRAIQVVTMVLGAVVADCAYDSDEETSNSESATACLRSSIYARRKKARSSREGNPRVLNSYDPSSLVSGSPTRPIVCIHRERRLAVDTHRQRVMMQRWTEIKWIENLRLPSHVFEWLQSLESRSPDRQHRGGKRATPSCGVVRSRNFLCRCSFRCSGVCLCTSAPRGRTTVVSKCKSCSIV
jgi:hypothetical protein